MLPFLEHDGVEVSNANRWMAYLKNGRALGLAQMGRYEILNDLYCSTLDDEAQPAKPVAGFSSPITDPAPWYDPTVVASGEFLGLLVSSVKGMDGVTTRSTTPRLSGIGGVTLGPQTTNGRILVISGTLMASSCRGLEYGKRWLSGVLANEDQNCAVAETHLRYCCSTGPDFPVLYPHSSGLLPSPTLFPSGSLVPAQDGLAIAYQTGLTSGPDEVNPDLQRNGMACEMVDVTFTITAGNPYIYGSSMVVLGPVFLAEPGGVGCMSFYHWGFEWGPIQTVAVTAPSKFGVTGIVATVQAGTGSLSGVTLFAYDDPTGATTKLLSSPTQVTGPTVLTGPGRGGPLDGDVAGVTNVQLAKIRSLPAGATLVYDSAKRTVLVTLADGSVEDGIAYLDLDAVSLTWIEIGQGDSGTIVGVALDSPCGANPDATAMIATQRRER